MFCIRLCHRERLPKVISAQHPFFYPPNRWNSLSAHARTQIWKRLKLIHIIQLITYYSQWECINKMTWGTQRLNEGKGESAKRRDRGGERRRDYRCQIYSVSVHQTSIIAMLITTEGGGGLGLAGRWKEKIWRNDLMISWKNMLITGRLLN